MDAVVAGGKPTPVDPDMADFPPLFPDDPGFDIELGRRVELAEIPADDLAKAIQDASASSISGRAASKLQSGADKIRYRAIDRPGSVPADRLAQALDSHDTTKARFRDIAENSLALLKRDADLAAGRNTPLANTIKSLPRSKVARREMNPAKRTAAMFKTAGKIAAWMNPAAAASRTPGGLLGLYNIGNAIVASAASATPYRLLKGANTISRRQPYLLEDPLAAINARKAGGVDLDFEGTPLAGLVEQEARRRAFRVGPAKGQAHDILLSHMRSDSPFSVKEYATKDVLQHIPAGIRDEVKSVTRSANPAKLRTSAAVKAIDSAIKDQLKRPKVDQKAVAQLRALKSAIIGRSLSATHVNPMGLAVTGGGGLGTALSLSNPFTAIPLLIGAAQSQPMVAGRVMTGLGTARRYSTTIGETSAIPAPYTAHAGRLQDVVEDDKEERTKKAALEARALQIMAQRRAALQRSN